MSVKLIANTVIDADDFLSASSQEGERLGIPAPSDDNAGSFRLLPDGTLADEEISSVATAAGTQTTLISDFLEGYGDGFFIGWTLTCVGGDNDGDTATITAFAQSTGTLTWVGDVTANTAAGDMFILSYDWEDVDFTVELTGSGDAGDATFKWSFDGTNYLGRDSLWQDTWIDVRQVVGSSKTGLNWIVPIALNSKTLLLAYQDDSLSDYAYCKKSTDRGMTYGPVTAITSAAARVMCGICLKSGAFEGRVIVSVLDATDGKLYYSDDDGDTWSMLYQSGNAAYYFYSLLELSNGNLGAIRRSESGGTYYLQYMTSVDGGKTWSTAITVNSTNADYLGADLIEAPDGTLLIAVSDDTVSAAQYEIRCWYSTDGGKTWTITTDIQSGVAGEDYQSPRLLLDIDATIYCAYVCNTSGGGNADKVFLQKTVDKGTTWDTRKTIITDTTRDPKYCAWTYLGPDVLLIAKGEAGGAADILLEGDMEDAGDFDTNIGTPTTNERSEDEVYAGTYSHKIVCDSDGDGTESAAITSVAGSTYNVTGAFYLDGVNWLPYFPGGFTLRWPKLIMKVLDGDGTLRHTETWTTDGPAGASINAWNVFSVAVTTPTGGGASKIQFVVDDIDYTNGPASVTFYIDDMLMIDMGSTGTSVRRGQWETFASGTNDAPVPHDDEPQSLICGAAMIWHGYGGISGDQWTFGPEYDYAMANIIEDSPSKPWRSTEDNIACTITIDMGATGRLYADAVGFFGCNMRTLSWQMDAASTFDSDGGSPTVDESVSFDFVTGGVLDSNSGANEIHDAALLAGYDDHELTNKYLRFTAGTLDTYTYEIIDNVGDYILVDGDTDDAALGDTFIIFQKSIAKTFTGGPYRYARISIGAQNTAEDYYQIGMVVMGKAVTLTSGIRIGGKRDQKYHVEYRRTKGGNMIATKTGERKRIWEIDWRGTEANMNEIIHQFDYLDGTNVAFIPDDSDLKDVYLCKTVTDISKKHLSGDVYEITGVVLEEIL